MKRWRSMIVALAALALAACGGDDDSPTPTATTPPAPTATPGAATLPLRPDQQVLYVINADGTGLQELYDGESLDIALRPDGRVLAISEVTYREDRAGTTARLVLLDTESGEQTEIASGEGINLMGWSPDGGWLALRHYPTSAPDPTLALYSSATGELASTSLNDVYQVVWAPDSTSFYGSDTYAGSTLYRTDVSTLGSDEVLEGDFFISDFDVSDDGEQVAVGYIEKVGEVLQGSRAVISTMAPDGQDRRELLSFVDKTGFGLQSVSWSPDGERIAYGRVTFDGQRSAGGTLIAEVPGGEATEVASVEASDWGVDVGSNWSPDGEWLLIERLSCTQCEPSGPRIVLAKTDGSGADVLPGQEDWLTGAAAWSPDGERFVYSADKLYVASKDGSDVRAIVDMPGSSFTPIEWSPDGHQIYFVRKPSSSPVYYAVNPDGSGLEVLPFSHEQMAPDGRTTADLEPVQSDAPPYLYNLLIHNANGDEIRISSEELEGLSTNFPTIVGWSPDSRYLALSGDDKASGDLLGIASVDGDLRIVETPGRRGLLRWSPDSSRIAYWADNRIWVVEASSGDVEEVASAGEFSAVDWSPDGNRVAYWDEGGVWSVGAGGSGHPELLISIDFEDLGDDALRWSPHGEQIAILGPRLFKGQELFVGSVDSGTAAKVLDGTVEGIEWTPDGSALVVQLPEDGQGRAAGLYLVDTEGGEPVPLTRVAGRLHELRGILADGRILFVSYFLI